MKKDKNKKNVSKKGFTRACKVLYKETANYSKRFIRKTVFSNIRGALSFFSVQFVINEI